MMPVPIFRELMMELVQFVTICVILVTRLPSVSPVLSILTELLLQIVIVNQDFMIMVSLFVKDALITVPPVPDADLKPLVVIPVLQDSFQAEEIASAQMDNSITVLNVNHVVLNVLLVSILPLTVLSVLMIESKMPQDVHVQMVNINKTDNAETALTNVLYVSTKLTIVIHVQETEKTNQFVPVHTVTTTMEAMLIAQFATTDVKPVATNPILVTFVKKEETIIHTVTVQSVCMMTELLNVNHVTIHVYLVPVLLITVLNVNQTATETAFQIVTVNSLKDTIKSIMKLSVLHVPLLVRLVPPMLSVLPVTKAETESSQIVYVHLDGTKMLN
jgi:hypothetical protein